MTDISKLSIGDLLTSIQRKFIEKMYEEVNSDGPMNPAVMAQINRFLAENGIVIAPADQPKVIEGEAHREQIEIPDFSGQDYNT